MIALNMDARIPAISVTANPLMGPTPNEYKIAPTKNVVMFASKIALNAFEYPPSIAALSVLPVARSSRTRSKISTLASTAIPMVNTIPAIPGSVRVALKPAKMPKIKMMLMIVTRNYFIQILMITKILRLKSLG